MPMVHRNLVKLYRKSSIISSKMLSSVTSSGSGVFGASSATEDAILEAQKAARETGPTTYNAGSREYVPLPADLKLERVAVIHRHGDRAQIWRSLGPSNPESDDVSTMWKSKLPKDDTLRRMACAFRSSLDVTLKIHEGEVDIDLSAYSRNEHLYSGEDSDAYPYAQLTELGAQQLIRVGRLLRQRYGVDRGDGASSSCSIGRTGHSLISTRQDDGDVYLRSTNMCRTLQSLRSLVVGLYDIPDPMNKQTEEDAVDAENGVLLQQNAPTVHTRPKSAETMFPQSTCYELAERRSVVLTNQHFYEKFEDYGSIHERLRALLGLPSKDDKVSWLMLKEILSCYKVHAYPYPLSLTYDDEKIATEVCGWMWGSLYGDEPLNRLAAGRFLRELIEDLTQAEKEDVKMLIYSGHDSSLVPILCALGIYDNQWPPYASYLVLEVAKNLSTGKTFVRALYNDEVRPLFSAHDFIPWEGENSFLQCLEKIVITEETYREACAGPGDDSVGNQEKSEKQVPISNEA